MTAFLAWYSIPPVMPHIQSDLNISAEHVYDSNVIAVSATIGKLHNRQYQKDHTIHAMTAARIAVGPFCERYGPRRVMAGLLLVGAVPCAMTGLVQNAAGLIGLRYGPFPFPDSVD